MNALKNCISLLPLVLLISCIDSNIISFKSNINIQIDGIFSQEDWDDAKTIKVAPLITLYLIQNEADLFFGIRNNDSVSRYVDLYLDNESIGTLNLHASMQLGERALRGNWNDTIPTWDWGNNTQWEANKVEIVNNHENLSFQESIKHYQGFEFKISKRKIKGKEIWVRIEIKDFEGQANDIIFPLDSERMKKENWYRLLLK